MNAFNFLNDNFGKYIVSQSGSSLESAERALSSSHLMVTGKYSRLASGWAIVKENHATLQLKLAADGIHYDDRTRYQAVLDALDAWDGNPMLLMTFDKKPLPLSNLFLTVDIRAVRICSPSGVQTFDYTSNPDRDSPDFFIKLCNQRRKNGL
ncbi:hypothetical protein N9L66_03375 [Porticoccaceae bacterium]|nr:hypothetical protein [Porticoccaceae bacterium]MDB2343113.1 hypothetical protein [Porticoccaceae bacterium]